MLEDNRETAMARLQSLIKRISRKTDLMQRYDNVIRQYLVPGHAEIVPSSTKLQKEQPVYYMPHKEVTRDASLTTKLRVVFDASSHAPGCKALNECLDTVPNLSPELLGILLPFRRYRIVMMADIGKAFLQIVIKEGERDDFRFLCFQDQPTVPLRKELVQEWRMTRVPFGSTSSPFMLTATLNCHFKAASDDNQHVAKKLLRSFYVDDLLIG